ncbi:MAG TPA: ABC transporter ATP-binding protein [Iamia sp.]|nr:ABC transporter ATP-binding protein [Iamia sp.]
MASSKVERDEPLLPLVRSVTGPVRGSVAVITLTSLLVGFAESGVLVLVAHAGVALSGADDAADIAVGPFDAGAWSVGTLIILALILALVRFGAQVANVWFTTRLVTEVLGRLRRETLTDFLASSWGVQSEERRGHLQDLMTSFVTNIAAALISCAGAVSAALTFAVMVVTAVVVDPLAALAVAVTVGILFAGLRPLSRLARSFSRRRAKAGLAYANSVNELAEATQDMRVFGVEGAAQSRVTARSDAFERLFHNARILQGLVPATYQGVAMVVVVGGLGVLYWSGASEIASLSALVLLFVRAATYGQQLQTYLQQVNTTSPYIELLRDARSRFREGVEPTGDAELARVDSLELRTVSFGYDAERRVLDEVSLSIGRGEVIGVVGPSGAGKSTLVQVLLGLRRPTEGEYLVNGRPAADHSRESWARRFTFVPQEPHLMAMSIAANIAFFRPDVDEGAVLRAARRAHIHDDVAAMPDGYATWVGDDGRNLSGGQRQRVAIARALAGDPDVIVLDEPTSALDMRSESLVQQTLAELKGEVTLVIVAHRLSTLAGCDRILVLGDGRVQAFDTAENLMETNAFYRQAVALSDLSR